MNNKDGKVTSPLSGAVSLDDELERWLVDDPEFRWEYEAERLKLDFAAEVDSLRRRQGLTQGQLAERCETSQPAISRFFNGEDERSPTLMTLIKLADAVGKRIGLVLADWSESIRDWGEEIESPADLQWSTQSLSAGEADSAEQTFAEVYWAESAIQPWHFQQVKS